MNDCCTDNLPTTFAVDCDNDLTYINRRVPQFILNNGNVYDGNLNYMFNATLEGNTITVNPLAAVPSFKERLREATMLKGAIKKQRRDEKRAKTS
jgi:hypothetical protein